MEVSGSTNIDAESFYRYLVALNVFYDLGNLKIFFEQTYVQVLSLVWTVIASKC